VSAPGHSQESLPATGGTTQDRADKQTVAAIVAVLTPYCLERAKADPRLAEVKAELEAATSTSRRAILAKAGWATPLGNEEPNTALAQACQLALTETP
jgi:hypothetical protein